jgi:hypothetical protein
MPAVSIVKVAVFADAPGAVNVSDVGDRLPAAELRVTVPEYVLAGLTVTV